jgi:hypothetical protein
MSAIKTLVRGAYDIQKMRIQMGNRIVGNFKVKLGQPPCKKEDEMDSKGKAILKDLRESHKKITDGVARFPTLKTFKATGIISDYTEFCLVTQYLELERMEDTHFKRFESILKNYPIYSDFLVNVRGCGPAMSGVIISEFDIHKARYPSSLWAYCGLDCAPDGKARSKRKEHLVDIPYINKDGEEGVKKGITYNPWLKSKLFVLGGIFVRLGGPYRDIYDNYKHRLNSRPDWQDTKLKHRHNAAVRYALKMFLIDLYTAWKGLEGLEIHPPYHEAKLGIKHAA